MNDEVTREHLSHFDVAGRSRMVNVGDKAETKRRAVATGQIRAKPATIELIRTGKGAKGDVLAVAQVAAVMAAKKTSDIIPMCHPLLLTAIDVSFALDLETVTIEVAVETSGKTGVEMEALTGVAAAALTIYDMVKAVDRGMVIESVRLEQKAGGASGAWNRDEPGDSVD